MRNKIIFMASALGLLLALASSAFFSETPKAQSPVFKPSANPFAHGIYADGMIESDQAQGENINIYPEVSGPIDQIIAIEGQAVHKGDALVHIDDSVQRASAEQEEAQAEAALATLRELKAQPRPETLAVSRAQVENARASLKSAQDQLAKQERSFSLDPKSISVDALDNARNAANIAATNLIHLANLSLPTDVPVSVPSRLVRQRPDVVVAETVAHAASANVGVATAALLPSFTLTGSYSANGTQSSGILNSNGRAWSFGGAVAAPVFEGGTLWFRRKAAIDQYQQAIAQYRSVVLAAFAQVADSLRALEHDAATLGAQDEALRTSKEALHLVQINYEAGLATYLDVLNSNSQYHQAVIHDLQVVAARYQDTVALYVALGGGWSASVTQDVVPAVSR